MRIANHRLDLCSRRNDDDEERTLWKFFCNLLDTLGAEGMSSDETDIENVEYERVFRLKVMFWRRDLSKHFGYLDQFRDDPDFFSTRGSQRAR